MAYKLDIIPARDALFISNQQTLLNELLESVVHKANEVIKAESSTGKKFTTFLVEYTAITVPGDLPINILHNAFSELGYESDIQLITRSHVLYLYIQLDWTNPR